MTTKQKAAVTRVLEGLGIKRVQRAMSNTCKVGYENHGWSNCFLTQAMGGEDKLRALQEKHFVSDNKAAISQELGIEEDDLEAVIDIFDAHVGSISEDMSALGNKRVKDFDDTWELQDAFEAWQDSRDAAASLKEIGKFFDAVDGWLQKKKAKDGYMAALKKKLKAA